MTDHRAHVVEPDGLAEFDDLRPDGNDLGPTKVNRAGKLVADVDAETAVGMQHPLAFVPDKVQVVDVALLTLVKADLIPCLLRLSPFFAVAPTHDCDTVALIGIVTSIDQPGLKRLFSSKSCGFEACSDRVTGDGLA